MDMTDETPHIVIAFGDGIGPEIMDAALDIIKEAGATLIVETIEIGARIYDQDGDLGILPSSLKTLKRIGALLYAPVLMLDDDGLEPMGDTLCRELELEKSQRFDAHALGLDDAPDMTGEHFGYMSEGSDYAIFTTNEHATPIMAGDNSANPSALLHAAIMMLIHVGEKDIAARVYNGWKKVIDAGYYTPDMAPDEHANEEKQLGTKEFSEMVISRLFR